MFSTSRCMVTMFEDFCNVWLRGGLRAGFLTHRFSGKCRNLAEIYNGRGGVGFELDYLL